MPRSPPQAGQSRPSSTRLGQGGYSAAPAPGRPGRRRRRRRRRRQRGDAPDTGARRADEPPVARGSGGAGGPGDRVHRRVTVPVARPVASAPMDVGRVGIWTGQLDLQPAARAREVAAELDELGYGTLWVPEAVGRDAITHAAVLLDATERMVVATGVANIYNRLPGVAADVQRLLADDSGGRFLLGLGVSHAPMVEGMLSRSWDKPLAHMRVLPRRHGRRLHRLARPGRGPAPRARRPRAEDARAGRRPGVGRAHLLRAGRAHAGRPRAPGRGPDAAGRAGRRAVRRPRGGTRGGPQAHGACTSRCPTT